MQAERDQIIPENFLGEFTQKYSYFLKRRLYKEFLRAETAFGLVSQPMISPESSRGTDLFERKKGKG